MPKTLPAAADKRARILDAARRLLVRRGYQDMAIEEVAQEAGVAKGTLYLYFKSKDELFAAAFEDLVTQLGDLLEALLGGPARGEELLRAAVAAILGHFDRNRDFIAHAAGGPAACGPRSGSRLLERFSRNIAVVERILERAGVGAKDRRFAAVALFGLCRSAFIGRQIAGGERPLSAETGKVAAFFLRGAGGAK